MKERLRQFMSGRYGMDQLGRCTMAIGAISLIIYMFTKSHMFYFVTLVSLVLYYYRALSRNVRKRYDENLKFLQLQNQVLGRLRLFRTHAGQRKDYRFYSCPSCHQKVRVPKGRGKIAITCPKCRTEFIRKS